MYCQGLQKRGFTLIELLVVIAIIAVLISILLPALHMARNEGQSVKCQANIRATIQCALMYMDNQEGSKLLPWYRYPAYTGYGPNLFTPWVFGGFQSQINDNDGYVGDYEVYPDEIRPLNKFVDPGKYGKAIIELYIDPGDRTHRTSIIGSGDIPLDEEQYASWETNGTSYTLNTRWAQGYALPSGNFDLTDFDPNLAGEANLNVKIAKHLVGGETAEFIFYVEQGFYSATYRAGPTIAGIGGGPAPQRFGWHRKWSSWNVGFFDGHGRSGSFDTRQIYGLGGTIWQPRYHPPGY